MAEDRGEKSMIPFDFEYYRPDSIDSAIDIFGKLDIAGKQPMYYGGGTEIISMGRMNNLTTGAVIDLKDIMDCNVQEFQQDQLLIGSAVTLTQIHEANLFPLLAQAGARVADHTIQNKITLGGNLCGTIIYKEAVLPLMLSESLVYIAGPAGVRTAPINSIFKERMQLEKGEFIIQIKTEKAYVDYPYVHVKQTKQDKISYPLVTICAMSVGGEIRVAYSGLCDFPFRSIAMEAELNNHALNLEERIDQAIEKIPGPIPTNLEGSAGYRKFIVSGLLKSIIDRLEVSNVSNAK
jgi:CO/xanthine dehydrogenase FAD-binding subunit